MPKKTKKKTKKPKKDKTFSPFGPAGGLLSELISKEIGIKDPTTPPPDAKMTALIEEQRKKLEEDRRKNTVFAKLNPRDMGLNPKLPPPTYYNSQLGCRIIDGKRIYHGENLSSSDICKAPKMTDKVWAYNFEAFEKVTYIKDPSSGIVDKIIEIHPAELNWLDEYLMMRIRKADKILILAFRGAHKSAAGTRFAKRQILDYGATVSYFSSTTDMAEEYSEEIHDQLVTNQHILDAYGQFVDPKKTNRKDRMFWLSQRKDGKPSSSREAGLSIGSIEGKSRMGGHPDILILDDVVKEDVAGSEKKLARAITWYTKQVAAMAKGRRTKIIVIGTMKDPGDLYNYLLSTNLYQVVKIPAIKVWPNNKQSDPEFEFKEGYWYYVNYQADQFSTSVISGVAGIIGGEVGFDEYNDDDWDAPGRVQYYLGDDKENGVDKVRMSMQEFLLKLQEVKKIAFEYEYQLHSVPISKGALAWDKFKFFDWDDPGIPNYDVLKSNCCAFFDQAFGSNPRADINSIAIVSKLPKSYTNLPYDKYYLIDLICWKNEPLNALTKKIEMVSQIYNEYPWLRVMGVEADMINTEDAKQIIGTLPKLTLKAVYQRQMKKEEAGVEKIVPRLPVAKDIKSSKHAKVRRIVHELSSDVEFGRFYVYKRLKSRKEFDDSKGFPYCRYFDPLDATAGAKSLTDDLSIEDFFCEGDSSEISFF